MDSEPKDVIVLGAIKQGNKKFEKIQKMTQIEPEELNSILEQLEDRGFIQAKEKKGLFGVKMEITITEKGVNEVDQRVHELQTKWNQMAMMYKTGDKEKLKQEMDMMMFSMMFSMMGMAMSDYVSPENMPDAGESSMEGGDADGGGFDFDIGF